MSSPNLFFGKYRGTVLNNIDPEQRGRLTLQVPDVSGLLPTTWALPCWPFGGKQMGFFALPQIGAGVWVEFEHGDPDYPIWTGCWYGSSAEVPSMAKATPAPLSCIVMQTTAQNSFVISDMPGPTGGIMLKTGTGAMITINDIGITITNGKGATIQLTGPSVNINAGALMIT